MGVPRAAHPLLRRHSLLSHRRRAADVPDRLEHRRPAPVRRPRQLPAPPGGPDLLEGHGEHLPVPDRGRRREPRAVLSRGLPPRPDPRRPRPPPRALLRAPPHDRGGHGLGLEVALPAGADRPLQRPPGVGGPLAAAVPALHGAGALRRPGARRLGGARVPDRDLPGRTEGDPAGVLRGGGDRRRRELAGAGGRDAPAPPADDRLPRRRQLDRVPPDLRLRLQHDERPGRAARLDQAARAHDLRDRLRPLPDGLRHRPDGRPVRDPPRHLAAPAPAVSGPE